MNLISEENRIILEESGINDVLKNSFHTRVSIIGGGSCENNYSEFINQSEYVVRTDFGKSLTSRNVGYKTDVLYLDRQNFTPFDNDNMVSNFDNYLHKKCFDDCREIWLPIHLFLMNEVYEKIYPENDISEVTKEMLIETWDDEACREVLYYHIKQLYCFYKSNIKMLDFDEYDNLVKLCGMNSYLSPLIYCIEMALIDSRFNKYDIHVYNPLTCNQYEDDYLSSLVSNERVKVFS